MENDEEDKELLGVLRDPVTGQKSKEFFLNRKNISSFELDQYFNPCESDTEM